MKFELKHTFDAPVEKVLAAMLDPALPEHLKQNMTTMREIVPLERTEEGGTVRRKIRYVPEPLIKKVGPKEVPPGAMAWVEDSRVDRQAQRITFENIAEHPQVRKLLVNQGTITFRSLGNKTERTVSGELNVKVFLVGKIAEKLIYTEAEKILHEEARALESFLATK